MKTIIRLMGSLYFIGLLGCSTQGARFFDSAFNDHNRAPASMQIPKTFDSETPVIDAAHNQAEADYLFIKADMESLMGRPAESIENLKSALVYDPQSATLMQRLSIEYYRKGQARDSLYWAEKANLLAHRRDLSLLLAGLYSSTKSYDKAVDIYNTLLKDDSADYEVRLYLGAIFSEQKNYKKAIEQFSIVANHKGTSTHFAHFYLARLYLEQDEKKNANKAEGELRKSIAAKSDFFEAISMLGQMIQKKSGQEKAIHFYAEIQKNKGPFAKIADVLSQYYIEKGEYDKAYEQLEVLDSSADDQIQVKLKMALILIDKKVYDLAVEKLNEILVLAPDSDKVRFYLSAVYEEKKLFQMALDQYIQINNDSPYFEESRAHAAYLSKLLGNPERSLKIINEVANNKVTNIQTYLLKAQLLEENKQYEKSIEIIQMAQKTFPKNAQAYFYEGTLYDKMNKKSNMLHSMEKALELEPDHIQAMNYIAFSLAEMNEQLDRAEQLARSALQKDKNDGFVLDTLGWILFKKGNYKEALANLEKAYELQPAVGIIAEHLGDVYNKIQKYEKARALFQKANELEDDKDRKRDIQIKLTKLELDIKSPNRIPASADGDVKKGVSP
ncbi:MAG: tetratricopeptide repeat protein [Pseudobdellovibrio sp.]